MLLHDVPTVIAEFQMLVNKFSKLITRLQMPVNKIPRVVGAFQGLVNEILSLVTCLQML